MTSDEAAQILHEVSVALDSKEKTEVTVTDLKTACHLGSLALLRSGATV